MPPKLANMKPTVAQRVLLSIGLATSLLFGFGVYAREYGSTLAADLSFQLVRIVVTLLALILGFGGKKKIAYGSAYLGSFLLSIAVNFFIENNPGGFAIFRGLFTIHPWADLNPREILPYVIIAMIANAPFIVAFFLRSSRSLPPANQSPTTQLSPTAPMPPQIFQGEQRTLRGDLESLAGLLREGLINQDDYDRKKEEILRRL